MITYLNCKKASNVQILNFLKEHGHTPLISVTSTELDIWTKVRKESHKRKIGPFSLNVSEAKSWTM